MVFLDGGFVVRCSFFECALSNTCEHVRCDGFHCYYNAYCVVCKKYKKCNINIFEEIDRKGLKVK